MYEEQKTQIYLNAAAIHLRFGRAEDADEVIRAAWRLFSGGLSMGAASETDLRHFGVMARIAGVGATPGSALARVRQAIGE